MNKKRQTLAEKKTALLEAHKKKLGQLNAQIKAHEAKDKDKERKADTRRKIIIGRLARTDMTKNKTSEFTKVMIRLMDEYIIKDADRELFELPQLPEHEQKQRLEKHSAERKKQNDIEITTVFHNNEKNETR